MFQAYTRGCSAFLAEKFKLISTVVRSPAMVEHLCYERSIASWASVWGRIWQSLVESDLRDLLVPIAASVQAIEQAVREQRTVAVS